MFTGSAFGAPSSYFPYKSYESSTALKVLGAKMPTEVCSSLENNTFGRLRYLSVNDISKPVRGGTYDIITIGN